MSTGKSSAPDLKFQIWNQIINYVFSDKLITQFLDKVYHVNQSGYVVSTKAMLSIYFTSRNPKKATRLNRT